MAGCKWFRMVSGGSGGLLLVVTGLQQTFREK